MEVKGGNHRWGLKDDKERYWRRFDRENLTWDDLDKIRPYPISYLGSRNYRLFAALADVRNHGDGIDPMPFARRGLPKDVSKATMKHMHDNDGDYHSHTHFTLEELMAVDLDKNCTQMQVALFPLQYMHWKETGEVLDDVEEEWSAKNRTKDPIHREVTEDEMILLLASGDPKKLTKKCDELFARSKQKKVIGGPYVSTYVPVSYRRLLPGLEKLISALAEYGPPDKVRVVIAFDN